jgi:hypothetical protein
VARRQHHQARKIGALDGVGETDAGAEAVADHDDAVGALRAKLAGIAVELGEHLLDREVDRLPRPAVPRHRRLHDLGAGVLQVGGDHAQTLVLARTALLAMQDDDAELVLCQRACRKRQAGQHDRENPLDHSLPLPRTGSC